MTAALLTAGMVFALTFCGYESPTVIPGEFSQDVTSTDPGIVNPRVTGIYPENGASGIPVDADIVIVFSRPVDPLTVNTSNITIPGVTAFNASFASDDRIAILEIINPAPLNYSTPYTVNISTSVTGADGSPLVSAFSSTFTTAADKSADFLPAVIPASRFPASAETGVAVNLQAVEVTFTRDMDLLTIDTASFLIAPDPGLTAVVPVNAKTYRLVFSTQLEYLTSYTVTLDASITDTDTNPLIINGDHTWNFTTEDDPAAVALAINNVWVSSVSASGAVVNFSTSKPFPTIIPIPASRAYIQAGIVSGTYTINVSGGAAYDFSLHTFSVPGLSPGTLYYFRVWLDVDGDTTVNAGDITSAEYTFRTVNDEFVNTPLSADAGDQNGLAVIQTGGTASYAFWVSGGGDIYGQYFDASQTWAAGGETVVSAPGVRNGIIAINDGFTDAVIIYNEGNSLYSKMIYNNAGSPGYRWPGDGASAGVPGIDLGLAIKAGSSYSAALVYEKPAVVTSGTADMPNNGAGANLLFDADVDFSIRGLLDGDYLVWNNGGIWTQNLLYNTQSYNLFPYVLRSNAAINLGLYQYYLSSQTSSVTGVADTIVNVTAFQADDPDLIANGNSGDIINFNGLWRIIVSKTHMGGLVYEIVITPAHGLLVGNPPYTIYPGKGGPFTSEAVTFPLWDRNPSVPYDPGVTVLTGDRVVNENDNTAAASSALVAAVNPVIDTDYAVRLSADIMDHADIYSILRMPAGYTYRTAGYSTSNPPDFTLSDTNAGFIAASVSRGDIIYNIDAGLTAMVAAPPAATSLSLSQDIFNAADEKYIIYSKRGFLAAYVTAVADRIAARAFSLADGSPLGSAFNVCTDGVNSKPSVVSDGYGSALIFYEKSGNVYVKKVSAAGEFLWSNVLADEASDIGITAATGYTIAAVHPDRAAAGTGGAYLLAVNTAGNAFNIIHVSGDTGAVAAVSGVVTGYNPVMAVDYDGGAYAIAVIACRNIHGSYYHIEARAYRAPAASIFGLVTVSSNTALYNCLHPSITLNDNSGAADGFYITWFDGRYFSTGGYAVYAQRFSAAGAAQWLNSVPAPEPIFVSFPASMGYDNPLILKTLYWNGGASPYGLLPLWLDYRSGTNTDIYYQRINDSGVFQ